MGEQPQRRAERFDGIADAYQLIEVVADVREDPTHAGTGANQSEPGVR